MLDAHYLNGKYHEICKLIQERPAITATLQLKTGRDQTCKWRTHKYTGMGIAIPLDRDAVYGSSSFLKKLTAMPGNTEGAIKKGTSL